MSRTYQAYDDVTSLIAESGMSFTPTISIYVGWDYMLANHSDYIEDERVKKLESPFAIGGMASAIKSARENMELAKQKFDNAAGMIRDIHAKGGLVVAGTDGPIIPYGLGLHIELLGYEEAGLSPLDVLRTATMNNAKVLGASDQLGSIEKGKLADLVILSENPLISVRKSCKYGICPMLRPALFG